VQEVAPAVRLRVCPGAPVYVAGLFNYRGAIVPVIDLSRLLANVSSAERLSTRIIVTYYERSDGGRRLLGLIAEQATQTIELEETAFAQQGLTSADAPFLGAICCENQKMIQCIHIERLMPDGLEESLFATIAQEG
jgi:chemotaxis-related protein WspB